MVRAGVPDDVNRSVVGRPEFSARRERRDSINEDQRGTGVYRRSSNSRAGEEMTTAAAGYAVTAVEPTNERRPFNLPAILPTRTTVETDEGGGGGLMDH